MQLYGIMESSTKQDVCKCGWGKVCKEGIGQYLLQYSPMDMLLVSISQVIGRVEKVSTEDIGPDYEYDDGYCCEIEDYHSPETYGERLRGQLKKIETDASITVAFARKASRLE
jgi:hypothetical protein